MHPGDGLSWNGNAVDERTALHYRDGSEFQATAPSPGFWAGITIPAHRLESATLALSGAEAQSERENCRVSHLDDATREMLGTTVRRAVEVARESPESFAAPEARRALAETLLTCAVRARGDLPRRLPERERTMLSHSRIVAAAEECMRARLGEPLYVADLCMATGSSERTLRSAFRNVYGMGPNRLLKLRRIHQVRRELERGKEHTLVSEVAQQHGFWDLGRFAGDYRSLVGESPSRTLRNARTSLRV
jgi:AraC-like DNA-binding protein